MAQQLPWIPAFAGMTISWRGNRRGRLAGGLPGYFSSSFAPGGVGTSNTLRVTETNE
jgi:hypothetical protein